ncbi:MAG: phosphatidate cytidylyltransferase [Gammaproteobacteria bacterium]|nr:phosphatidate cytidylyltransferase [Gammaproteobacteria bacterium]MCZ6537223.1 phosphatidate cytidylyltransferase [Gammaproteobacteria bacterium]
MLKQRIITAVILVAVLSGVVLVLPPPAALITLTLIISLGIWEWSQFLTAKSLLWRLLYVVVVLTLIVGLWFYSFQPGALQLVLQISLAWWLVAFVWVTRFPTAIPVGVTVISGILVLGPAWLALSRLLVAENGVGWIVFILLLVWATDIGAFAVGKLFGRIKLIPRVSPGKTWEGAIGGVAVAAIVAFAGAMFFQQDMLSFVSLCLAASAISIVGDLIVSIFKRHAGLKDSGEIFPGHGGMLDRIDSICSAAPVFVLGLSWQGLI